MNIGKIADQTANGALAPENSTELLDAKHPAVAITTAANESAEALAEQATRSLINDLIEGSVVTNQRVQQTLEQMEMERQVWESTELFASHARLYAILTKCYQFYLTMKSAGTSKGVRGQMRDGLDSFIRARGFKTLADSHEMNRVVKAVFGEDRRRVSAYASALRVALTANTSLSGAIGPVPAANLGTWISDHGGIEEIRKSSAKKGVPTAERLKAAKAAIQDQPLMTFKPETSTMRFDTSDVDKMMILIVTYLPTGEVEINSVVKNAAVCNAALLAHYAENKEEIADFKAREVLSAKTAVSIALETSN